MTGDGRKIHLPTVWRIPPVKDVVWVTRLDVKWIDEERYRKPNENDTEISEIRRVS